MVSKEFHASRRARYRMLLKENSMGFVFAEKRKRTEETRCFLLRPMPIFIISQALTSRRQFLWQSKSAGFTGDPVYRPSG